jgi:hypothetical protein
MKINSDVLMKRVWLINGFIFFLVFVILIFIMTFDYVSSLSKDSDEKGVIVGKEKEEADKQGLELQTIVFSSPDRILDSEIYIIKVGQIDYEAPKKSTVRITQYSELAGYEDEMKVNVIFINSKTKTQRLLLNKKASINRMDIPNSDDSLRKYILYKISLHDSDGNGRINSDDKEECFISNLDGSNFKKIELHNNKVLEYNFSNDYKKIQFICSIIPQDKTIKEEYWDRTFLEYDTETNKILEYKELTSLFREAKEIMLE